METDGYQLVVAKKGSKLSLVSSGEMRPDSQISTSAGRIIGRDCPLFRLVNNLSGQVGTPVEDETGLEGNFDFRLEWTPDNAPPDAISGPLLFAALRDQFGLELKPAKLSVSHIFIERAERPSEK